MMDRIYMDHSATTPVRKEVAEIVVEYMTEKFGNPSTVYSYGQEAKIAMIKAREQIASVIAAMPEELFFTSGGTEADNVAIIGTARALADKGKHIITTSIEHQAVLNTCLSLEKEGFEVSVLPVDEYGMVRLESVEKALRKDTTLISVMHVNSEVGTIQPIEKIGELAREHKVLFHVDAVQSIGKLPIDVNKLGVDLLSGSGHKIYGPKGTGFLYMKKDTKLSPLTFGGSQEKSIRPGTENLPGIVGLGLATELAAKEMETEMPRLAALRDLLVKGLMDKIPYVHLNGHPEKRVAINANLCFEYVEGESLLLALDLKGISASSGSACSTGSISPSHVLTAMGMPKELAQSSVRFTLGKDNKKEDIDYLLEVIPPMVERFRNMSPMYNKKN